MTQYFVIALLLMSVALGIVGKLYTDKLEEFGKLEASYNQQREEVVKANAEIESLKKIHTEQIVKFDLMQKERQKDEVRYKADIRRINELRSSSEAAALKEPERFGRIATFRLRRGLRDVCRGGGGSAADCKIKIPKSDDAITSPANKPNDGSTDSGAAEH